MKGAIKPGMTYPQAFQTANDEFERLTSEVASARASAETANEIAKTALVMTDRLIWGAVSVGALLVALIIEVTLRGVPQ